MSCLYSLNINLLSVISFANIFCYSRFFFVSLMVSFDMQKFLSIIKSHLCFFVVVFFFFAFPLGSRSKNIAMVYVRVFYLCSLLRALWVQVSHLGL